MKRYVFNAEMKLWADNEKEAMEKVIQSLIEDSEDEDMLPHMVKEIFDNQD